MVRVSTLALLVSAASSALLATLQGCGGGDETTAGPVPSPGPPPGPDLETTVNLAHMKATLTKFNEIAMEFKTEWAPAGSRDRATGYNKSRDYILEQLGALSSDLQPQTLAYWDPLWKQLAAPELSSTGSSGEQTFKAQDEVMVPFGGSSGSLTAAPAFPSDELGCNASTAWPAPLQGAIAVVRHFAAPRSPDTCSVCDKVKNAEQAGAGGVIIVYNQSELLDQFGFRFCFTNGNPIGIPMLSVTREVGEHLDGADNITMSVSIQSAAGAGSSSNVCVDVPPGPGGDKDKILAIGAHLDSVPAGPGINDNGSGSALILEILRAFGARYGFNGVNTDLKYTLRACWFGSEEWGLLGSYWYLDQMSAAEKQKFLAFINYDMMGSPNGCNFVNNGAQDSRNPEASTYIMQALQNEFAAAGVNSSTSALRGSDFHYFGVQGIPIGGLLSGASGLKTAEQAAMYGGVTGVAHDACYHKACDTLDRVDEARMLLFAQVTARTLQKFVEDPALPTHLKRQNLQAADTVSQASFAVGELDGSVDPEFVGEEVQEMLNAYRSAMGGSSDSDKPAFVV